jgi:hypothetical protein
MIGVKSSASSGDRMNGTSNPKLFTRSFIFALSVETCITSNKLDALAVFRIYEIIGFPQKSLIFL